MTPSRRWIGQAHGSELLVRTETILAPLTVPMRLARRMHIAMAEALDEVIVGPDSILVVVESVGRVGPGRLLQHVSRLLWRQRRVQLVEHAVLA